jgi:hypothetical protein
MTMATATAAAPPDAPPISQPTPVSGDVLLNADLFRGESNLMAVVEFSENIDLAAPRLVNGVVLKVLL